MTTKNAYGRPYANGRGCKITGGKKAFGWNWNVANRRVVFAHDAKGVLHLIHVSGVGHERRLPLPQRLLPAPGPEHERYRLPRRLHLDAVSRLVGHEHQEGGRRRLHASRGTGKISLHRQHSIRRAASARATAASSSIKFTAAPTKKQAGYLFGGSAAQFKVTKMTPVPYLIPGTPEEAAKREGV